MVKFWFYYCSASSIPRDEAASSWEKEADPLHWYEGFDASFGDPGKNAKRYSLYVFSINSRRNNSSNPFNYAGSQIDALQRDVNDKTKLAMFLKSIFESDDL